MKSLEELDLLIESASDWLGRAGEALFSFYDDDRKVFIRETVPNAAGVLPTGKTSTNRTFIALVEYLQFLEEERQEGLEVDQRRAAINESLSNVVGQYFHRLRQDFADDHNETSDVRKSEQNGVNMFTDSHLVLALVLHQTNRALLKINFSDIAPAATMELLQVAEDIATQNRRLLEEWKGGRVHPDDRIHDFITLHVVRAVDAIAVSTNKDNVWSQELVERIRQDVLIQLGHHSTGLTSQFDPAELAFSVAVLNRVRAPDHIPLTRRALDVISESQTPDGSWPTSRVISFRGERLLHVASYEVALALAYVAIDKIENGAKDLDLILPMLERTFRLVTNTFQAVGPYRGWSNDRTRDPKLIESWATAVVFSFVSRYRSALLRYRQVRVLARYEQVYSPRHVSAFWWPDLAGLLGAARAPKPEALLRISDPTEEGLIEARIKTYFVDPVANSNARRPSKVSLLLPGPPGTRKTSLVNALSDALGWPILTLTPPDFLAPGGLEQFEVQAATVFRDLMRLRRVVILFDECEDFFRKRSDDTLAMSPASRTMGAFITAGMLPRLQRLRENGWVIFALATNEKIEALDPAAIRQGRFDFQQKMDHPVLEAQFRYVCAKLDAEDLQNRVTGALSAWEQGERPSHTEDVSFALLDAVVKLVKTDESISVDSIVGAIREQLSQSGPPVLSQ